MAAPKPATIPELIEKNKIYSSTHEPIPTFAELGAMGIDPGHTAIITCADPRCVPEKFFNLQLTDGAIIFRNVGGHVSHCINDILALDGFLKINDILIVHHTDCGTTHFKDPLIREGLKARLPEKAAEIDGMSFGAIDDLEQSVRDDIAILKANPFIRKELAEHANGFVYDLKSGVLTPVKA